MCHCGVLQVIAACGSDDKCQVTQRVGAQHSINYRKEDLRARVKELTNGEGVNVVVDMVGGKMWDDCVRR